MTEMKKGNLLWKANTAPLGEDNPLPNKDVNSDSALAKLEQVRVLLSGAATETKLEQARVLLASIADVDFATESTLEEVGGSLATLGDKDFATQTTLAALLADIALMKADLAAMKTAQTDGSAKVGLSGTIDSVIKGSDVAIPVDLQFHDLANNPIPVLGMPVKYKATGEYQQILARSVRSATQETKYEAPIGARGVYVFLIVHSLSGTDAQVNLRVRVGGPGGFSATQAVSKVLDTDSGSKFTKLTSPGNNVFVIHPDFSQQLADRPTGTTHHVEGYLPHRCDVGISIVISGTNVQADCEVVAHWLP